MGQRMSAQEMLCFKQGDQSCQSGVRGKVLSPRCVLPKPSPPILLPLATQSRKPTTKGDLLQETQKNRKPDHLRPPIIKLRPQRMDRTTVRTPISPQRECLLKLVKKPAHITMTPQSWTSASGATRRTKPRILLSPLLQKLDIDIAIQYQVKRPWGIAEDNTPGGECILGYPFSFSSIYPEKKKDLYNKR
jgi:hypothetical protein